MKVYIATRGSYDEYEIVGVFATFELAAEAGSNEPDVYEISDELPPKVTVREMHWSSSLMHQVGSGHFHAPDPDPIDCPYTNVLRQNDPSDTTSSLWPWDIDEGETIPSCEVSSGGTVNGRWVSARGVDREEVEFKFNQAVLEAKSKLILKDPR